MRFKIKRAGYEKVLRNGRSDDDDDDDDDDDCFKVTRHRGIVATPNGRRYCKYLVYLIDGRNELQFISQTHRYKLK